MEDTNKLNEDVQEASPAAALKSMAVDKIKDMAVDALENEKEKRKQKLMDTIKTLQGEAVDSTLDTASVEDPKLYDDGTGRGAKIAATGNEGNEKKNKKTLEGKPSNASSEIEQPTASGTPQERLEDYMSAMFNGEEISEDFKNKAETIFVAAVNEKVSEIEDQLIEELDKSYEEKVQEVIESLTVKLDDYLNYVVEQWMEENKLQVENGIRTEVAETFMSKLKDLFEECYIEVPEEKYDLVDGLVETNSELEEKLNSIIEENVSLKKELTEQKCGEIFHEESEGLVDTEVERLASLTEGLEYENEDQFRDKVRVLKDSYFGKAVENIAEEETTNQVINEDANSPMDVYANTISRHVKYTN
jgi:hypothetical protein